MTKSGLDLRLSLAATTTTTTITSLTPPLECRNTPPLMNERPTLNQQQITMFYNGQVLVCDMIELQARAIILLASRELQGGMTSRSSNAAPWFALQCQNGTPTGGSLKRSLQKFLQKRKSRSQLASPYNHL